jgi:hypothetical protein
MRESGRGDSALRLYHWLLALYPRGVRKRHGDELWQTGRDMVEAARAGGAVGARFWLALYADTLVAALDERWRAMRGSAWTAWLAAGATLLAVAVSIAASLNLYLLEDGNPLTDAAFSASALLRFSYDGAYIAALVAGLAGAAVVACALLPARVATLGALGLAALIALSGFGGLLARHPLNGLALIGAFTGLALLCLLAGWGVARTLARRAGARRASLIGACAGAGVALLADAAALVAHTLALNPVSHALYMQGQIGATPYNATLLGMLAQALMVALCAALLALALWPDRGVRPTSAAR